jgi:hypothetical protein
MCEGTLRKLPAIIDDFAECLSESAHVAVHVRMLLCRPLYVDGVYQGWKLDIRRRLILGDLYPLGGGLAEFGTEEERTYHTEQIGEMLPLLEPTDLYALFLLVDRLSLASGSPNEEYRAREREGVMFDPSLPVEVQS